MESIAKEILEIANTPGEKSIALRSTCITKYGIKTFEQEIKKLTNEELIKGKHFDMEITEKGYHTLMNLRHLR